jgi:hypothetical protein
MKGCVAVIMIFAGLCMIFGFWPVAIIVGGFGLLAWAASEG